MKGRQPIARVSLGDFEFFYALTANRARPHSLGLGLVLGRQCMDVLASEQALLPMSLIELVNDMFSFFGF